MRKLLIMVLVAALAIAVAYELPQAQMGGPGMMGEGQEYGGQQAPERQGGYGPGWGYGCPGPGMMWGYGPGMMGGWGGYGMGPGMMGGWGGYGMGPGMMHGWGGYGMGPGMMHGWGGGYGPGYGYGPESQKFLDETRDLRQQLHMKMFDYMEAARNPNTKPEQLNKMQEEIWNLKKQIYEKYSR